MFRDGRIHTHPALPALYEAMIDLGVLTATRPDSVGGQQIPMLVYTMASAYLMAANLGAYGFIGLTHGAAHPSGLGYHAARIVGYSALGTFAGALGGMLGGAALEPGTSTFAFVLAATMLIVAFVPLRRVLSSGTTGLVRRLFGFLAALPPLARGVALGLVTPLLPCGLLYAALAISASTGSGLGGAAVMFGFASGIVPALAVAQWKFAWVRDRVSVRTSAWLWRSMVVVSAAVLVWRGVALLSNGSASCCGGGAG